MSCLFDHGSVLPLGFALDNSDVATSIGSAALLVMFVSERNRERKRHELAEEEATMSDKSQSFGRKTMKTEAPMNMMSLE